MSDADRRHLYFGLLFVAHFANNLAMVVTFYFHWFTLIELIGLASYGVTTGQPVLLAMWAVFARQRLIPRALLPIVALGLLVFVPMLVLPRDSYFAIRDTLPQFYGYQAMLFGICGAAFLFARWLLGWRMALCDADEQLPARHRRLEFSMRDLLGLTAFCALALGASRVYQQGILAVWQPLLRDSSRALVALTLLPIAFGNPWKWSAWRWPALAFCVSMAANQAIFSPWNYFSFYSLLYFRFHLSLLATSVGFFGSIWISLRVAYWAGYRLEQAVDPQQSSTGVEA